MEQEKELKKINELFSYLGDNSSEQIKRFSSFMEVAEQDGKVSAKTKEAIALGIAIKSQCKGCIAFHTKNALEKGFTKEEILEIAWVAVLMGVGPSLMYMANVKEALEEFSNE
jgi:AhpD family alkylhydroperoxidase